ncbi:baeRF7 domain-containing protein [Halanaerobium congolense]|uniref:Uncharacterized protein n=1 Tax=Halanaerobium congolense TaxID=54121 RepID=A0A1G6L651_9FIRM|nr:hypothetical protein [Halanaerobium congolense]PXV64769.1 hypothetical protein C8C78_1165 [Halanaerobium congolense]TDS35345.1 hypothetical protein BY453_10163 [Halanaerobium congolense]SDC38724.1 hypothetical protein SAMN04488597_105128 [Halanaerobium congolense]SDK63220.1 hypothetical protein SAMN04515655_10932 [Halanaerobium congolense]SDM27969.1 hypothetical protein SAMN04488599_10832 [Halanaerobium congolense]
MTEELKLETLKDLIQCQDSPCISIYMSTKAVHKGEFKKLEIEFKNLLQKVEEKLKADWGFKEREINKLLESAFKLASDSDFWQQQKEGLAVFISSESFRVFKLSVDTYDNSHVSYNFNLKQLISEIHDSQEYYLLALSSNHNQLYRVNRNEIEEFDLEELPQNIKEFLNLDDEAAEKYQSINTAGSSSVFHGQGAAGDDDNEDLLHYLKEIDRVINSELKDKKSYLIVAADDSVFSLYKNINNYQALLDENLSGNAKQMNNKELREKSWEIIDSHIHDYLEDIKERYMEIRSSDKSSSELEEIVEAAHYGKVDTLVLNKLAEKAGVFVEDENEVKLMENTKDYDLYNYAAVETIKNGGSVYSIEKNEMPEENDILAIYRY